MDEDELLRRYGTRPDDADLDEIRRLLDSEQALGTEADTLAMKLLCVQLFNAGNVEDVLRIWLAKESGFDAHCSIDVQLLCGTGLDATRRHLAAVPDEVARQALEYLETCVTSGDFDDFDVEDRSAWYDRYYGV